MLVLICNDMFIKHAEWLKSYVNKDIIIKSFCEKNPIDPELIRDAAVIISRRDLSEEEFEQAKSLKLLQVPIAGYEKFNIQRLNDKGINIANNGGTNALSVAEHTIMLILTANRRFPWHYDRIIKGPWQNKKYENRELSNSVVGIMGFGNCGRALASILYGFKTKTIYYDIRSFTTADNKQYNAEPVSLKEILEKSDYLSVHLPLTAKTTSIISYDEFHLMKNDAVFINTSRGGVVNEDALINALKNKQIRAAGLDVFAEEPLPDDSPLKLQNNLILTPHCAPSYESMLRLRELLKVNINNIFNGIDPIFLVESYD